MKKWLGDVDLVHAVSGAWRTRIWGGMVEPLEAAGCTLAGFVTHVVEPGFTYSCEVRGPSLSFR
jgi:hypothetical protein